MTDLYIFDLDGTLRDAEHRVHLIQGDKPDWRAFFAACEKDTPIWPTIRTLQRLRSGGAECWIWSGCSDEVRNQTTTWLWTMGASYDSLRMRKAGDRRPDHVIKREWLDELSPQNRGRITAVFEDRDRVVQMWREAGLTCYQVAPGNF